jgi:hypothetical protein
MPPWPTPSGALPSAPIARLKDPNPRRPGPRPPSKGAGDSPTPSAHSRTDPAAAGTDRGIRCRQCGHGVTRPRLSVSRSGAFHHTFANPHGIVFEIGCFTRAEGCALVGPPSNEFSWFPGYDWRVAVCRACLIHLGWRFSAPATDPFFGLIIDRLRFPGRPLTHRRDEPSAHITSRRSGLPLKKGCPYCRNPTV